MQIKVVVNISDMDKAKQALKSSRNLINELKSAKVEIVFNQNAINLLRKGNEYEEDVKELINRSVDIVACRNSMNALSVKEEELIEGCRIVNAGVAEIAMKESEGWSYLKL